MNEPKRIKITEKGSREFYQEIVNVTAQYSKLLRRHDAKLNNEFKTFKRYIILCIVMLIILLADAIFLTSSTFTWVLIVFLAILAFSCYYMLSAYNKRVDAMLKDDAESELTLDDDGIELVKTNLTVKLPWENTAFVRVFNESVCFLPKSQTGMIIAVSLKYYNEIKPYIKAQIVGDTNTL